MLHDCLKSVRNRCVIELFDGFFVLSLCIFDISVGIWAFVIGLIRISPFFMTFWIITICRGDLHRSDITLTCDLVTELDLTVDFELFTKYHKASI